MRAAVPVALTSFVGRERELAELVALLDERRLVTVTGPGGVGKTRLVSEASAQLASRFSDGVFWVDLAPVSDAGLVLATILGGVGRRDIAALPGLVRHLSRRRALLVLDNCEHVIDGCASIAEDLLRACPQLRVLATSREPLRSAGETCWALAPLRVPAESMSPAAAASTEAVTLFRERARAIAPSFMVDDRNAAAVAAVCRRLDGIPLAIELAASRVRALSVEEIQRRLDQRFELLMHGPRTARAHHRTLRAMVDWSHDLLPELERRLLRRLAVFSGGWTLAAAESVCGLEGDAVVSQLAQLVERSLVIVDPARDEHRYRLLETMREYAWEKLAESGEVAATRDRHLAWALQLMDRLGPQIRGAEQPAVFAELEVEHANLLEALEWAIVTEQVEVGLRVTEQLWWFWFPCGFSREATSLLTRLLALPQTRQLPKLRAGGLEALGVLQRDSGDVAGASAAAEEALAIRRRLGDRLKLAESLVIAGWAAIFRADFDAAGRLWSENLALAREIGSEWNAGEAMIDLGWLHAVRGELVDGRQLLDAGVATMRRLDSSVYVAYGLFFSAYAALLQGRSAEARRFVAESLSIFRGVGGRRLIEPALTALTGIAAREGAADMALWLAGATEGLREELGLVPFPGFHDRVQLEVNRAARTLGRRAGVLFAAGRAAEFEDAFREAMRYAAAGPGRARPGPLSSRQAAVADLVAQGMSNREIASALSVADGTVKRHVEDILTRLGLETRAQIAVWAVQNLGAR